MTQRYTARIYADENPIMQSSGDDVEKLYIWMLAQVHSTPGDIRGEIINNATKEIIRRFKKTPID